MNMNTMNASHARKEAIQETLYLLSMPGIPESVREGLETPIEECAEEPGW